VETACDVAIAMDTCRDCGLRKQDAEAMLGQAGTAVSRWRAEAARLGIPRAEQERMAPAFQAD
jgi:hypothetical protein